MSDTNQYRQKLSKMRSDRVNFDNYWQEVSDYCLPKRDFLTERSPGTNRMVFLYEEIGVVSTEALASALHSMMTPEVSQWFKWRMNGASPAMSRWLDGAGEIMFDVFRAPKRRLYLNLHEAYLDLVAFGNAVIYVGKHKDEIYFKTRALRDCLVKENDKGVIDTIYYECKMTINELREMGEWSLHSSINDKSDGNQTIKVLHVVEPRYDNAGKGARKTKKPFKSCYIDLDNDHVMHEDGYDDFPYVFARFQKRANEQYGYGPAMTALSTVKMMNTIKEVMIRGATKAVDPVTLSPAEGLLGQNRMDPGSIVYYDPDMPEPKQWNTQYRPDYFEYILEQSRQNVERVFYTNWMNMPRQPNMTATEVIQRTQESLRMFSPMLARLHSELLSPLLKRAFDIMMDMEFFEPLGPLPDDLDTQNLEIEYVSPMDQTQRISSANNILQGMAFVAQAANFDPTVVDVVSPVRMVEKSLIDNYNWPVEYLSTEDEKREKDAVRQAQAQQQQALQLSEIVNNSAQSVESLNEAS